MCLLTELTELFVRLKEANKELSKLQQTNFKLNSMSRISRSAKPELEAQRLAAENALSQFLPSYNCLKEEFDKNLSAYKLQRFKNYKNLAIELV